MSGESTATRSVSELPLVDRRVAPTTPLEVLSASRRAGAVFFVNDETPLVCTLAHVIADRSIELIVEILDRGLERIKNVRSRRCVALYLVTSAVRVM